MKRRLFLVINLFSVAFPKLTAGLAAVGGPSLDVFLRFSPLIGGPKFAPLHVEVMIKKRQSDSDAFNRSTPNEENVLHRFDFVPSSPTDPRTLGQLLTFRSVPGLVRYRTLEIRGGEGNRGGGPSGTTNPLDGRRSSKKSFPCHLSPTTPAPKGG